MQRINQEFQAGQLTLLLGCSQSAITVSPLLARLQAMSEEVERVWLQLKIGAEAAKNSTLQREDHETQENNSL